MKPPATEPTIDLVETLTYFRELLAMMRAGEGFARKVYDSIPDAPMSVIDGMHSGQIPWTLERRVAAAAAYFRDDTINIDAPEYIDEITADNVDDLMLTWQETRRESEVAV